MREIRLFGHYLNVPLLAISTIDVLVVGVVFYLSASDELSAAHKSYWLIAVVGAFTAFVTKASVGLYQIQLRTSFVGVLVRVITAFGLGLPVVAAAAMLLPLDGRSLITALVAAAGAYGLLGLLHAGFFALADAGAWRRRVLVLGAGDSAARLLRQERRADRRGYDILGFVPFEEVNGSVSPVLKPERPLCSFAMENCIDEIVVALDERRNLLPIGALVECRFNGIAVVDIAEFVEREAGKVRLDLLRQGWLVFDGNRVGRLQNGMKRLLDVTVALLLLFVTLPVTVATLLAIKYEDGWRASWLYRQKRVGKEGNVFELLKVRSMREDAEADGRARWASTGDARITRVGRIIRKARIDELPQLWNVLRGDMSMAGPRPERPEFVADLERDVPYYAERLRIQPGITGWAQLLFPYGASQKEAAEKLEYDLYYLKNRSLMLDAIILVQTVEVVLFGKGAR